MKKRFTVPISMIMVLLFIAVGNIMAQPPEIIFLSDDDNDNYNIEFLQNQGLTVTKFWVPADIQNWGVDTLAMLDAADLIIIGRSVNSGMFQDSIEAATWDNIDAPIIYNSPYHIRSNRNKMLNTSTTVVLPGGSVATAVLPGDEVFANVTLDDEMLKWLDVYSNGIENKESHNGTVVAQINDSVPLLIRWDAGVAFYEGSRDTADGERVYFGLGAEPTGDVKAKESHFPLSRAAKQVYLNEVTRILGIAQQVAEYSAVDYNLLFLTDWQADDNDDYNFQFLRNQGLRISKFWVEADIQNWGVDTLAMLDAVDLIVIGRSVNSGMFQDSIEAATWDNIDAPIIYNSPYHIRSNRNKMINTTITPTIPAGSAATVLLPGDVIFNDVTLDADMLTWFDLNSNGIQGSMADNNGTVVAQLNDTVPLIVRWDAGVAFYEGSRDTADAERVYFGLGIEPADGLTAKQSHFPLSKPAKTVYLAEITRILGVDPLVPVFTAPDYTITFLINPNERDATQRSWLRKQGFKVNSWYGTGKISTWTADTIDILNNSELIIVGRSVGSGESQDTLDRAVWNSITAPMIWNSPWACRNTRNNMFNSGTTANYPAGNQIADVIVADDPILQFATVTAGQMDWYVNAGDYLKDLAGDNQGTWVVAQGDTIPLVVRFEPNKAFYAGGPDSAVAERVFFSIGTEGAENHFNMSKNAQAVYFAEIVRLLGGIITTPEYFSTNKSLIYLEADMGTWTPDFAADVLAYGLDLGEVDGEIDVTITATAAEDVTVEGDGVQTITDNSTPVYIVAISEIGQRTTYTVTVTKTDPVIPIDGLTDQVDSDLNIYPNPFNDVLTISTSEDINYIQILDMQGRVVLSTTVDASKIDLNLNDLNAGIYILKAQVGVETYSTRITKN